MNFCVSFVLLKNNKKSIVSITMPHKTIDINKAAKFTSQNKISSKYASHDEESIESRKKLTAKKTIDKNAPIKPPKEKKERTLPEILKISKDKYKALHALESLFPTAFSKSVLVNRNTNNDDDDNQTLENEKKTSISLDELTAKIDPIEAKRNHKINGNIDDSKGDSGYELYVESQLQILKSFRSNGPNTSMQHIKRPEQLAGLMLRNMNYYMSLTENEPTTHFLLFDRYDKVPITKGVEQKKRNQTETKMSNNNRTEISIGPSSVAKKKEYLTIGNPIPSDWGEALEDREGRLSEIIRFITSCWIKPTDNWTSITPLAGKRVIIDGHNQSRHDLEMLGVSGIKEAAKLIAEKLGINESLVDFKNIPVCIEVPQINETNSQIFDWILQDADAMKRRKTLTRLVYMVPQLWNDQGEDDTIMYYMIRKMCQFSHKNLKTKIFNVDTDGVFYGACIYIPRWYSNTSFYNKYNMERKHELSTMEKSKQIENKNVVKRLTSDELDEMYMHIPYIVQQTKPKPCWVLWNKYPNTKLVEIINLKKLYVNMDQSLFFRISSGEKKKLEDNRAQKNVNKSTTSSSNIIKNERMHMKEFVSKISGKKEESETNNINKMMLDKDQIEDIDDDESEEAVNNDDNDQYYEDSTSTPQLDISKIQPITADQNNKYIKNARCGSNRALNFILIWLVGGTDYNEGYKNLTHQHIATALKLYHNYIGNVITLSDDFDCGISINGEAYVRLLKCVYMVAKEKTFKQKIHPSVMSFDRMQSLTSHLKNSLNPLAHMDIVKCTLLHSLYTLKMIYQIGNSRINVPGNITDYAYAKLDETLPPSRDNIKRLYSQN
jgi:hypothetical protein